MFKINHSLRSLTPHLHSDEYMMDFFKKLHGSLRKCCYIVVIFMFSVHTLYANTEIVFDHLIVLGIGGNMGAVYKKHIFEKIRPHAKHVYACDLHDNPLQDALCRESLIDYFIPLSNTSSSHVVDQVKATIQNLGIEPDGIVTFREEYLIPKTLLANAYGLPSTSLAATSISTDKYKTKEQLKNASIATHQHGVTTFKGLDEAIESFGFPLIVKPSQHGLRSEWVRCIHNAKDIIKYKSDLSTHLKTLDENTIFCLEAYLDGHEVDVDLVLYNGVLMYSTVSDNFNTYLPYGLETGHLMPSILPKYIQRSIAQKAYESVKACGHDRGVFHVELMLQPNGDIFVIEINGRLGGMYIANWHETLFGVDLIKAELAIARDMNPSCFLKKKQTQRAFAQLCVTTNNEKIMKIDGTIEVYKWTNFGPVKGNRENYLVEKWVEFPYIKNVNKNGHPNLGAITVEAKTPLLAFQKLAKTVDQQPPILQTNYGLIESSTKVLRQFCSKIPSIINRYKIRITTQKDKKYIVNLLSYLTNSVTDSNPTKLYIPHDTAILVMEDKMHIKCPIIATIGLHFWNRMRPNRGKSCYIHDLVVTPTYRNLLLGTRMMHSALTLAKNNQVHKMELACDASLDYFYHKFGFSNVGSHLVKYMEGDEKKVYPNFSNKSELEKKGAWLYGQHIVQNYLKPIDPMLIIPKHFFIPKTGNHSDTLEDVYKHKQLYFVKYSLKGANAFSPLCQRGENSSRNRQLNTTNLNKSQIRRELKLLLKQAPQSAAGIVLQTAIDQSIGCLFHAEMSKSQIEIDMLAEKSTKRAYALSRGGVVIDYAEIPGNSNFENWKEACQKLVKRCDNYFNFLKKKIWWGNNLVNRRFLETE